jgi:hypothetical protein
MDGQAYLRALVAREEAEGIATAVVEAERQGGAGNHRATRRGPTARENCACAG